MAYVRKVKTASGATAVQVVEKCHGVRRIVAHVGSAHDDADLAVLMASARDRIHAGQQALDLPLTADVTGSGGAVVTGSASEVLWEVLLDAYGGWDSMPSPTMRSGRWCLRGSWSRPRSWPRSGCSPRSGCRRRTATPSPRRCAAAWPTTTGPPSPARALGTRLSRVRPWSLFRRLHQTRAIISHYRRRGDPLPAELRM